MLKRLREKRHFIHVLYGPRQVGKTTAARQVMQEIGIPAHYATADQPSLRDEVWLEQQWEVGRSLAHKRSALLVIDEIQKVSDWAEGVKRLWDEDTASGSKLRVLMLGSSRLMIQKGLTESLAGRFETIRAGHWSFKECSEYFGWDLDTYIFFGGYPGAADLIKHPDRWRHYMQDSLIETTISRDVLLLTRVDKPALLRRLFAIACEYSGQILSYNKMLGQLSDAGNTTTLAHYLDLLNGVGFVTGLHKYSGSAVVRRGSSPKLQVCNTALVSAQVGLSPSETKSDSDLWGRLVESAVGAHLLDICAERNIDLYYWRDRNDEVDFVLRSPRKLTGIEVKSGRTGKAHRGMSAFSKRFNPDHVLLVGSGGIPLAEFLRGDLSQWT